MSQHVARQSKQTTTTKHHSHGRLDAFPCEPWSDIEAVHIVTLMPCGHGSIEHRNIDAMSPHSDSEICMPCAQHQNRVGADAHLQSGPVHQRCDRNPWHLCPMASMPWQHESWVRTLDMSRWLICHVACDAIAMPCPMDMNMSMPCHVDPHIRW